MNKRQALMPALLSGLLLSATPVLAAQLNAPAAEQETKAVYASKTELKAFDQVKIPITRAIAAAEKHASGSRVIDTSFDAGNGKPVYKVKTYQSNSVWEGIVDAQSGQVVGVGTTTQDSQLDQEDKAELAGLQHATTTLAQAVGTAEKRGVGKAISAGLEETNGKIVYEVMIVKNSSIQKVVIDPKTGQIND
jgi:uncharacterized membrane protein YkoI